MLAVDHLFRFPRLMKTMTVPRQTYYQVSGTFSARHAIHYWKLMAASDVGNLIKFI